MVKDLFLNRRIHTAMCFNQEGQERKYDVCFSGFAKAVVICPKSEPLLYMVIQKKGYFPKYQCKILCAYIKILRGVFIFDDIKLFSWLKMTLFKKSTTRTIEH